QRAGSVDTPSGAAGGSLCGGSGVSGQSAAGPGGAGGGVFPGRGDALSAAAVFAGRGRLAGQTDAAERALSGACGDGGPQCAELLAAGGAECFAGVDGAV